jgi:hypothetical protein
VPSMYRTIRPSASRLRCIRKISPLRRFSNVRKLPTIHPYLRPMLFENKFLRILSLGPPTGSKPFGQAVIILVYSPFGSWRAVHWP